MDITKIKTGDIFYYDSYTAFNNKTHNHKCKVLFVGSNSIFYDAWWWELSEWTFVPVRKRLTFYRFSIGSLHKLTNLNFNGFEAVDIKSAEKLFLKLPEILLRFNKQEIYKNQEERGVINLLTKTIAFVPLGPKRGWMKPVFFETKDLTKDLLLKKILENQNLEYILTDEIVIDRIGLHNGIPSYCIKTE